MGITAEEVEQRLQEKAALSDKAASEAKSEDAKKEEGNGNQDTEKKTEGEESTGDDKGEWDDVPFHKHPRFIKLLAEANEGKEAKAQLAEAKAQLAEINAREAEKIAEAKKEYKMDPNMPFDKAIEQIKKEAAQEALELLKAEQAEKAKADSEVTKSEQIIIDWFELLKDTGLKLTPKDEQDIAGIAIKFWIPISKPDDLLKVYEIFDLTRKTSATWKAKEDSTHTNSRNTSGEKSNTIDYSRTSWSNMGNAIAAKLWVKPDSF